MNVLLELHFTSEESILVVFVPEELLFSQIVLVGSLVRTRTVPSPFEHLTTENPRRLDQLVKLYHPQL